jgi:hypothetical protein
MQKAECRMGILVITIKMGAVEDLVDIVDIVDGVDGEGGPRIPAPPPASEVPPPCALPS